jgi:hypothetical protein
MPWQTAKATPYVDGDLVVDKTQDWERGRLQHIAEVYMPLSFGGSLQDPVEGTGLCEIVHSRTIRLIASQQAGLSQGIVFTCEGFLYVSSASMTVTPKVYDYTTIGSPTLVTAGSPSNATSPTPFSFQIASHPAGTRDYRLILDKSADLPAWVEGGLTRSPA